MATKITRDIIESYLNCKYKGHLKLAGESGRRSDYEAMTTAAGQTSRKAALTKLVLRFGAGDACGGVSIAVATLKQGSPLLADATLEDEGLSIRLDALKRAAGTSKLGDYHYLPVLHTHGDKVGSSLLRTLGGHRRLFLLYSFSPADQVYFSDCSHLHKGWSEVAGLWGLGALCRSSPSERSSVWPPNDDGGPGAVRASARSSCRFSQGAGTHRA
jgi:hypothetical protein